MSLILEALRKSEAERRRAQAPDLFAEPQLALPRPQRTWPPWAWPALAVVGLIAILMLVRAMWPQATSTASMQAAQPTPVAKYASAPSAPDKPYKSESTQVATAVTPPQPAPQSLPLPAPAPARPAQTEPAAPSVAANTPAIEQPRSTPEAIADAPAPAPAPVPAPTSAAASDTMRLSDLGIEERKQLPTLKLSMHMWNDAPAQRFVILDGQRLGEGDRIGDAVVEQITHDGAILDWNGRRLRVSMR